jgi:hypothetical protein
MHSQLEWRESFPFIAISWSLYLSSTDPKPEIFASRTPRKTADNSPPKRSSQWGATLSLWR